jgi:plastocyanin
MRFYGLALLAGAAMLGACGGGGEKAPGADTAAKAPEAPASAPTTSAPGAVAKIAATGQTHEVKMYGDDKGYRFDPANLTIKSGDAVKFIMVSGGPHNVAFDPATVPADSKAQLNANMDQQMAELQSPLMINPNEAYTVSFGGIKPGQYPFHCVPHLAMNMKGVITVQ